MTSTSIQNTPITRSHTVAERVQYLMQHDQQFCNALSLARINEAKMQTQLGLAQVVQTCLEGYAERPALGRRAAELVTDPISGVVTRQLTGYFETITYGQLWRRTKALASYWQHAPKQKLKANEVICLIAFAGIDFVTTDLAAIYNGAVVVPLQTNAPTTQLLNIVQEVEPAWLATSAECLKTAVSLVLEGHRPKGILLFDYDAKVTEEVALYQQALARLDECGLSHLLVTLDQACEQGSHLPAPILFAESHTDKRLCTLYYTSGSTGMPKGAMYPESMIKPNWRVVAPVPFIYMHYMPMNHSFGRSGVFFTLGSGGTCYFTAKSDLSELFNDIKQVRPTLTGIVPRICEMVYQHYQSEFERRSDRAEDMAALKTVIELEIRNELLGGRLLSGSFGSAPLAPELRSFMDACLGFKMDEFYGATEVSGVLFNGKVMRPPIIDYKLVDVPELGYFTTDKPYPRGELLVKSHSIMLGYYKRPEVTAAVFDPEGYYMTGDIMAQVAPDELVYLDRRNNVIKLSQGEFVAIAHLESILTNGHPIIRQVYLYGTSERSYLLAVIVPNEVVVAEMAFDSEQALKAALREAIKEVAEHESLHAYEVPRDFIVEHDPFTVENGLLAGIGKYQRPKFKDRYAERLEQLYEEIAEIQSSELQTLRQEGQGWAVSYTLTRVLQATLGIEANAQSLSSSFTALGGDSMTALLCSSLLQEIYQLDVPVSVINSPSGTLEQVVRYIERAKNSNFTRPSAASVHGKSASQIHADELVLDQFLDPQTLEQAKHLSPAAVEPQCVLITGANGYLGRFLCLDWLERMAKVGGRVICIGRGQDAQAARARINEAFETGDDALLKHYQELAGNHLQVIAGDLGEPQLGVDQDTWQYLTETVDVIVHPAAFVNHVMPYAQLFEANVLGTAELIGLALTHHLKPFHYVSTVAAAMTSDGKVVDEDADVRIEMPIRVVDEDQYANGYANSKWAGEVLLRDAHERFGLPVAVFRSDMILAHSQFKGQINAPDMFSRWLASVVLTGLAPTSFYETGAHQPHYDGLPVDFTARAIAGIGARLVQGFYSFHVINPHEDGISMDTFVDWAQAAGYKIERLNDYAHWHERFGTALRALPEKKRQQSFLPLLHQLVKPLPRSQGAYVSSERFVQAVRECDVASDVPHIDQALINKYLQDLALLGML